MEPVPSKRSEDAGRSQALRATDDSRGVRTTGGRSLPVTTTTTATGSNAGSTPAAFEVAATPTMGEMATWEMQIGDDHSTASQGPDFRKTFEMATPTLVDEVDYIGDEEDEAEMILLTKQRLRQGFDDDADAHLRRTPGAHMSRSQLQLDEHMRRTPGATQMHRSAGPVGAVGSVGHVLKPKPSVGDASGLGFGLTLSTPVAASKVKPGSHASPWSSSRDATWGLHKASAATASADSARESYSPTTERLSVDLGSLLLEDEPEATSQFLFGDKGARATSSNPAPVDSWSMHFNLESKVSDPPPKATKPAATRRRGKADGVRRSSNRGNDRTGHRFSQDTQQPKPVRGVQQPSPMGFELFGSPVPVQPHVVYGHTQPPHGGDPTPLFQQGGAFAPLPKAAPMGGLQPPPPSMAHSVMQPSMGALPNFQTGPSSFDPTVQQPISFGPPMEPYPRHTETQNATVPMDRPVFDFQGQMPTYGYPGAATFQPVQPFFPVPAAHPQQPQMPHFGMPGPVWTEPSWNNAPSPWQMGGDFGYAPPPTTESPAPSMTPTPSFVAGIESQPSDVHSVSGLIAPSPVPSVKAKKNQTKGAKKQGRPEKGPKVSETANQASTKPPASHTKRGKKKQSKDRSTPSGQPPSSTPVDDVSRAYAEETTDGKKGDASKAIFNKFKEKLKLHEKQSFAHAEEFVKQTINDDSTPASIHCKVYLELAEVAKRANKYETARKLYQEACERWPTSSLGWVEYSKLEEECGNMKACLKIVYAGLELEDCQSNDTTLQLLLRAIKLEEKMGDIPRARELLARLKHGRIEDVWKIVSEGAQLEARAGNNIMARRVLKYLMHHRPWHGPLYHDVNKFEKELGRFNEAFEVVERGLAAKPDYGPLWFDALWLCEQFDYAEQQYRLPKTMAMVERATNNIIRETVWKVHLEAAQMLERSAVEHLDATTDPTAVEVLGMSRRQFIMAILTCQETVRWKVWLAAGRMEAVAGNPDRTRQLVRRAHTVVPEKQRAVVLLECARHEEFFGDKDLAKAILVKSRSVCAGDWKVWLESVLFEVRYKNVERAVELAVLALTLHSGTGRLWASLVQLRHDEGEESQFETLKLALNAVPKSGEVWCEGARVHLNPLSRTFDIPSARRQLVFATKFTPQFGDGFLETLRLEIVDQWLVPIAKLIWDSAKEHLLLGDQCNDDTIAEFVFQVTRAIHTICHGSDDSSTEPFVDKGTMAIARRRLQTSHLDETLDVVNLRQRCANADPNYGSMWFFCGAGPTATARKVWSKAVDLMLVDLRDYAHVYLAALIRSKAILARFDRSAEQNTYANTDDHANVIGVDSSVPLNPTQWEESIMAAFLSTPSLESMLKEGDGGADTELLGCLGRANFATGLVGLSRHVPTTLAERRKALFGTDALFS